MQTRRASFAEATASTATGFILSLLVQQFLITPVYGLPLSGADNFAITVVFTVVSIARQYVWRRFFNWLQHGRKHAG